MGGRILRLIDWQYCPKWHFSYNKTQNDIQDWAWWEYWICIGPIQTRWGGKPWLIHLRRSPEYTEKVKKILLEDLKSVEYYD